MFVSGGFCLCFFYRRRHVAMQRLYNTIPMFYFFVPAFVHCGSIVVSLPCTAYHWAAFSTFCSTTPLKIMNDELGIRN